MKLTKSFIKAQWRDSDGYWVELVEGYCDADNPQCHTITEANKKETLAHQVVPCPCRQCAG